jgi:hypothetical protein
MSPNAAAVSDNLTMTCSSSLYSNITISSVCLDIMRGVLFWRSGDTGLSAYHPVAFCKPIDAAAKHTDQTHNAPHKYYPPLPHIYKAPYTNWAQHGIVSGLCQKHASDWFVGTIYDICSSRSCHSR